MPRLALVAAVALLAPAASCRMVDYASITRHRHAIEVPCDYREVTVSRIGPHTYAARGCHASAVYVCNRGGACRIDGDVRRDAPPVTAPPTPAPRAAAPPPPSIVTESPYDDAPATTSLVTQSPYEAHDAGGIQDPWH